MEHQAVGVGHVLAHSRVDAGSLHDDVVRPTILHGLATGDDVGRDVLRERGAGLYHGHVAHARLGILHHRRTVYHTIAYHAVAGNLRAVAEHAAVAHHRVVGDVDTLHQEVPIAQHGLTTSIRATVDDHVLANGVVVADGHEALRTIEIEVLRQGSNHRALKHLVVLAHARTTEYADEGIEDAVVANFHVVLNVDEGIYLAVVADFRLGRDVGLGTDITCHNYSFLMIHS